MVRLYGQNGQTRKKEREGSYCRFIGQDKYLYIELHISRVDHTRGAVSYKDRRPISQYNCISYHTS